MGILSMGDVVVAPLYSSFTQSMPLHLSIGLVEDQVAPAVSYRQIRGEAGGRFCIIVGESGEEAMDCFDSIRRFAFNMNPSIPRVGQSSSGSGTYRFRSAMYRSNFKIMDFDAIVEFLQNDTLSERVKTWEGNFWDGQQ